MGGLPCPPGQRPLTTRQTKPCTKMEGSAPCTTSPGSSSTCVYRTSKMFWKVKIYSFLIGNLSSYFLSRVYNAFLKVNQGFHLKKRQENNDGSVFWLLSNFTSILLSLLSTDLYFYHNILILPLSYLFLYHTLKFTMSWLSSYVYFYHTLFLNIVLPLTYLYFYKLLTFIIYFLENTDFCIPDMNTCTCL